MAELNNRNEVAGEKMTRDSIGLKPQPVSAIAVAVGIVCIIIVAFSESRWFLQEPYLDFHFMPPSGAMIFVFALIGVNFILRRVLRARFQFSRGDILVIYSMVMLAGVILSYGLMQILPALITSIHIKALDMPKYWQGYYHVLSHLLVPQSEDAIWGFFEGGYDSVPWADWIVPIVVWSLFWGVVFFVLICLAALFRKWWTDRERLTFPMTVLPLAMTGEVPQVHVSLWKDNLTWYGVAVAGVLGIWSILSHLIPLVPSVPNGMDLARHFTSPPFDILGHGFLLPWRFVWNPILIGLGYIIPLDVVFSLWFFFILYRVVYPVIINMMGLFTVHHLPLTRAHLNGAIVGYGLLSIWLARRHLAYIVKMMFSRSNRVQPNGEDSNEPMSYKFAAWGFVLGFLVVLWFVSSFLQVSPLVAVLYLSILLLGAITFARARSETGFPANTANMYLFYYLDWACGTKLGTNALGIAFLHPLEYGYFDSASELALQAYRMGDETNVSRRSMTRILFIAFGVAVIMGWVVYLPLLYKKGAYMVEPFFLHLADVAFADVITGERFDYANTLVFWHAGFAAVFAMFLGYMRSLYVWWPFNPVGFVLANNDWMWQVWGSFFIAWLVKVLLLRYAGAEAYRRAMSFFIGLMVGAVMTNALSTIVNMFVAWS